jgi:copper homeostasis protein
MPVPQATPILMEICIASVEDALAASSGGADRLELNTALALGGLTPSLGVLQEVRRSVGLPVVVMIRPRAGGFSYSDAEFRTMQRDLDLALEHGAAGIAFGVLTDSGHVDVPRCRELIRQAGKGEAVFHRAFDVTLQPFATLEQLIDLGVRRVMTSGQEPTALQGSQLIADLIDRAGRRIEILAAGGINLSTIAEVLHKTHCTQVHASLRSRRMDRSLSTNPRVSYNTPLPIPEDAYEATDLASVIQLRALLQPKYNATQTSV